VIVKNIAPSDASQIAFPYRVAPGSGFPSEPGRGSPCLFKKPTLSEIRRLQTPIFIRACFGSNLFSGPLLGRDDPYWAILRLFVVDQLKTKEQQWQRKPKS
jgi:hypothetical protein